MEPAVYYDHLGNNHNCPADHQGVLINRSHCSTGSARVDKGGVLQFELSTVTQCTMLCYICCNTIAMVMLLL